jgi:thiol-disulfide isomerase/thioredoxin
MILSRIKKEISFIFKAGFTLICYFSFTIPLLKAQTHQRIELNFLTENLTSRVLYPLFLKDYSKTSYKNIPSGTEKSVLTFFDIDRIQSAYERYMVNDNDSAAWNTYVHERKITNHQVYNGNLKNSYVGVFTGIDSIGNKIMIWDSNGNADLSDDKVYSVPQNNTSDTTFSVDIPFQYYNGAAVIDTILNLGFFPKHLFPSSNNLIDPELGIAVFTRANFIGNFYGKNTDYRFIIVPTLTHRDSVKHFEISVLDKSGSELRRSYQTFDDTIFLDGSDWKILNFTEKEIVLEQVEIPSSGYRTGQLFKGIPVIQDFVSKEIIENLPKGKYVLIDFWGTWCKPCIEQIPELVEFWKKNRDKVTLISVLHDEKDKLDSARQIIADNGMDWIHVWDDVKDSKWARPMGINAYPGFIFIGKDNVVLSSDERGDILKLVEGTIEAEKQ